MAEASLEMRKEYLGSFSQAELCLRPHRLSSSKVSWPLASLCLIPGRKILRVGLSWCPKVKTVLLMQGFDPWTGN